MSVDSVFVHKMWDDHELSKMVKGGIPFPMLSDGGGKVGSIFGVYGIVLFMTALCVRLCSLTSLGAPFAAPLSPPRAHNPDLLTRHPLWQQRWRTWLGSAENNMRSRGRMRGWDRRGQ